MLPSVYVRKLVAALLGKPGGKKHRAARPARAWRGPRLEVLEDRLAPAVITTLAGTGGLLNLPSGAAVDAAGDLFIADTKNNVVREVNATTHAISIVAGNGTAGYTGDNGAATSAELRGPVAVAVDAAGDLFISDSANNVVREVNHATGVITTVAGNPTAGYSGDGGAATSAHLSDPTGVAVDGQGDLFIADNGNNVVREVNGTTHVITTVAGNHTQGYSGDGGAAASAALHGPAGVAVDAAGDLFIADSGNNVVREVSAATQTITTVAGDGTKGYTGDGGAAASATLSGPQGVAVDANGNLFIADTGNNVVREVSVVTHQIATVAGDGTAGYSGDNGLATSATLSGSLGVAIDGQGDLYIADTNNSVVREVALPAIVAVSPAGGTFTGGSSITITWTNLRFTGNVDLVLSADGGATFPLTIATNQPNTGSYTWVVPTGVNTSHAEVRVQATAGGNPLGTSATAFTVLDPAAPVLTSVAGDHVFGYTGNNGQALSAELADPTGVAVDSAGDLFFADTDNNVVREVTAAGVILTVAGTTTQGYGGDGSLATMAELDSPTGVALDSAGDLFIADAGNNVIREVNVATQKITTVAGDGVPGYAGDNGQAVSAELAYPTDVVVDGAGDLFIADYGNNVVREVNAATKVITTVAGDGSYGYSGDSGAAAAAELAAPSGVAVDGHGNLFIADSANNVVREVNHATGVITTVAGTGVAGYSGDDGPATSALLRQPYDVAVDANGDLFIADSGNNVVRQVSPNGLITTLAGNESGGYGGDKGPAVSGEMIFPQAVAADSHDDVFVADSGNNVLRKVNFAPVLGSLSLTQVTTGASYTGLIPVAGGVGALQLKSTTGLGALNAALNGGNVVISGTAPAAGNVSFSVSVEDGNGVTISEDYTLEVNAAPTLGALTPAQAETGGSYGGSICISGGVGPYTLKSTSGLGGLSAAVSGGNVDITGTAPGAGNVSFGVTLQDASGVTFSGTYTLTVDATPTLGALTPAQVTTGGSYAGSISISGGVGPYTLKSTSGLGGLSAAVSGDNVDISGTAPGASSVSFSVTLQDASGVTFSHSYTLAVNAAPALGSLSVTQTTAGAGYSGSIPISGGTGPYTVKSTSGLGGLSAAVSGSNVNISGTAPGAGSVSFSVTLQDASGVTFSHSYTLTVNAAPALGSTLSISQTTAGASYSGSISISGGTGPYTLKSTSGLGGLGAAINGGNVDISGTAPGAGGVSFSVTVEDAAGVSFSQDYSLTVNAAPTLGALTPTQATAGGSYAGSISISGGTGPYTLKSSTGLGGLGAAISGGSVLISGTPAAAGADTISITVVDAAGVSVTQGGYTLTIDPALSLGALSVPQTTTGAGYSGSISLSGGSGSYTLKSTSGLGGLSASVSGGNVTISGTAPAAGTVHFGITVEDGNGATLTENYTLTVNADPTLGALTPAQAPTGSSYSGSIAISGGTGPYTLESSSGLGGLSAAISGSSVGITGTAPVIGTVNFSLSVEDSTGATVSDNYALTVTAAPSGAIHTTTPTFTWAAVAGATGYELYVRDLTTGQNPVLTVPGLTGTSYPLTEAQALIPGNSYEWYLGAVATNGSATYSGGLSFTVAAGLGAPSVTGPTGAVAAAAGYDTPTFSWAAVPNADHYLVYVIDQASPNSPVVNGVPVSGTSYTVSGGLTPGHSYSYYVSAASVNNAVVSPSKTQSFTLAALGAPGSLEVDGATPTNTPIPASAGYDTPTFSWSAVTGANHYYLYVMDATTQTVVVNLNNVTGTSLTSPVGLNPGDSFTWQVGALPADGAINGASFVAGHTFSLASLSAPGSLEVDGTTPTNTPIAASAGYDTPTFSWSAVTGASRYYLYVMDTTTQTVVVNLNNVTGTSLISPAGLNPGDSFSWQVGALPADGAINGASFTAGHTFSLAALGAPGSLEVDGATPTNTPIAASAGYDTPTFSWSAVTGASRYYLYVMDATTGAVVVNDNDVTGTSLTSPAGLNPGDSFSWQVGALPADGAINGVSFTAGHTFSLAALGAPGSLKVDGSIPTNTPIPAAAGYDTPTFSWSAVTGANHYYLYVMDATTQTVVVNLNNVTGTSLTSPVGLNPGDSFTWQVGALPADGAINGASFVAGHTFSLASLSAPGSLEVDGTTPTNTPIAASAGYDTPTFSWSAVTGASRYYLYVMDTTTQTVVVNLNNVTGTSLISPAGLNPGDSFSWQVGALPADGAINGASFTAGHTFSLAALGAPGSLEVDGATPTNTPIAASAGYDTPTFSWSAVTGASRYYLYVMDATTGAVVVNLNNVSGATYTVPAGMGLRPGDSFSWQVGALPADGAISGASFVAGHTFSLASLSAPGSLEVDGASTPNTLPAGAGYDTPTLTWAAAPGANHYLIYLVDNAAPGTPILDEVSAAGTSFQVTGGLTPGHSYTFYVGASSADGSYVVWSQAQTFALAALAVQI
jgi:hypothetical protein